MNLAALPIIFERATLVAVCIAAAFMSWSFIFDDEGDEE